jgi:hypothetical protein
MSDDTGYSSQGTTSLDSVIGVSLTGVAILNGVSIDEVDPMFPAVYADVTDTDAAMEMFDMCLAHPAFGGMYHYHAFAPCAVDSSYAEAGEWCDDITDCADDVLAYGEDAYADS